ncbi:hypothetical protein EVAR_99783_1 [Eumeta japonica]|uniref:Uncharacterized protein n=1 Tax=Eumeta variegata TaxID=151549 RepID=A0A4C2AA30_EUMVA|nr:hypothetical protein EVAR_99783_1 [Eumeta japonica]
MVKLIAILVERSQYLIHSATICVTSLFTSVPVRGQPQSPVFVNPGPVKPTYVVSESSGGILPLTHLHLPNPPPVDILLYVDARNTPVIPLGLRVSMDVGDHLLCDESPARLPSNIL